MHLFGGELTSATCLHSKQNIWRLLRSRVACGNIGNQGGLHMVSHLYLCVEDSRDMPSALACIVQMSV